MPGNGANGRFRSPKFGGGIMPGPPGGMNGGAAIPGKINQHVSNH